MNFLISLLERFYMILYTISTVIKAPYFKYRDLINGISQTTQI